MVLPACCQQAAILFFQLPSVTVDCALMWPPGILTGPVAHRPARGCMRSTERESFFLTSRAACAGLCLQRHGYICMNTGVRVRSVLLTAVTRSTHPPLQHEFVDLHMRSMSLVTPSGQALVPRDMNAWQTNVL